MTEDHPYTPNPYQRTRPEVGVLPRCSVCWEPYWSALHPVK